MYARVVTLTGVQDVDAAAAFLRETAPEVRSQRGFRSLIASADRSGGLLGVLSLWETEADRDASESALSKVRDDARGRFAADLKVEMFEQRVVEVSRPPEVGSALMVTRFSMDPGAIEENLEYFRREIVPQISAGPGFRALRNLVNPQTGHGLVGTAWDDRQAMEGAAEMAQARREEAIRRGVSFGDTSYREVVYIDTP